MTAHGAHGEFVHGEIANAEVPLTDAITNIGNVQLLPAHQLPPIGVLSFPEIADAPSSNRFIAKLEARVREKKPIRYTKPVSFSRLTGTQPSVPTELGPKLPSVVPTGIDADKEEVDPKVSAGHQPEPFVPRKTPLTESESIREDQAKDRAWGIEFAIELGLVFLGLAIVPTLYYNLVQKVPTEPRTYTVGSNTVDGWLRHLVAPMTYFDAWTDRARVPSMVVDPVEKYPATFVFFGSLMAVIALLLNRTSVVHAARNMTKLQASPLIHTAIAWSWLGTFALTFENFPNLVGWYMNFFGSLVGFVLLVAFSHVNAVFAQGGVLLMAAYVFSGLEKKRTTGEFRVNIPDPFSSVPSVHSGAPFPSPPFPPGENLFSPSDMVPRDCSQIGTVLGIWSKMNRNSFVANKYLTEVILFLFGVVKLSKNSLRTKEAKLGAYIVNGSLIVGSLGSMLFKMSANRANIVPIHV